MCSLCKEKICGWFRAVSVVELIILKNNLFFDVLWLFFSCSYQSHRFSKKANISICTGSTDMGNNLPIGMVSVKTPSTGSPPSFLCVPSMTARGVWCWFAGVTVRKFLHLIQNHRVDSHLPWLLSGQREVVISMLESWSRLLVSILETCTGITNCTGGTWVFGLIVVIPCVTGRKHFMMLMMPKVWNRYLSLMFCPADRN